MSERKRLPNSLEPDLAKIQIVVGASGLASLAVASVKPAETTDLIGKVDNFVINNALMTKPVDIPPTATFILLVGGFATILAKGIRNFQDR